MAHMGDHIRVLREKKQWTQEELAEKLHVTRQTVSNYEKGRSKPDVDMIKKIAVVLEADVQYLFWGENLPQNKVSHMRIWLGAIVILGATIGLIVLHSISDWYSSRYYIVHPYLILNLLLDPTVAFAGGWWSAKVVHTVLSEELIKGKWNRRMRFTINVMLVLYGILAISGLGNNNLILRRIPGCAFLSDALYHFCLETHTFFCMVFVLIGFIRGIPNKLLS